MQIRHEQQLQQQRDNVLFMQNEEALSAALLLQQHADMETLRKKVEITAAAVAAATAALKQKEAEDTLRKQKEDATAASLAALETLRKDTEEATATAAMTQKEADDTLRKQKEDAGAASLAALEKLRKDTEEATATAALKQKEADDILRKQKEDYKAAALAAQEKLRKDAEAATATAAQQHKDAEDILRKQKEDVEAATLAGQEILRKDTEAATATAAQLQKEDATGRHNFSSDSDSSVELLPKDQNEITATSMPWVESTEDLEQMARFNRENEDRLLQAHKRQLAWNSAKKAVDVFNAPPPPPLTGNGEPRLEDFKSMIEGLVKDELARSSSTTKDPQLYDSLKPLSTKKRKRAGRKKIVKVEKVTTTPGLHVSGSDSDSSVEILHTVGPNTARRILWQRGHNAMLPSVKHAIIEDATVDSVAEAHGPLSTYGFAIIRDMTEVFAPKNRCTREQRDFITKCMSTFILPLTFCSGFIYDFVLACCFLAYRCF